jgi:ectoine hydroxylase
VQGVEPFAHFDAELRDWGLDARFVDPVRDLLGVPDVELFTEKLNVKRAWVGGPIVLHQDYPYWVANSENAAEIATAVVFLDDAHRGNGGLEVLPGSHTAGPREGGARSGFGKFEMKPDAIDPRELVALEVEAGSAVFFGSLLVHRSLPNRSGGDRRTLLYSYQPAGRAPSVDSLIELLRR